MTGVEAHMTNTASFTVPNLHPSYVGPVQETLVEVLRACEKFGLQDLPSFEELPPSTRRTDWYGIPTETLAKYRCDTNTESGALTWADIFIEEVSEAFDASSDEHLRVELVQVAAMALGWLATIDRVGTRPARIEPPFSLPE